MERKKWPFSNQKFLAIHIAFCFGLQNYTWGFPSLKVISHIHYCLSTSIIGLKLTILHALKYIVTDLIITQKSGL